MAYTLNPRQRRLMTHTCDVYRVDRPTNTDGKGTPGAETLARIAQGVPLFYQFNPNLDDPTGAGRMNRATIFTTDLLHFPLGVDVDSGYWVKNTTPGDPNAGQVHRVLGSPMAIVGTARRRVNTQTVEAMVEEHPPVGIT